LALHSSGGIAAVICVAMVLEESWTVMDQLPSKMDEIIASSGEFVGNWRAQRCG
jgi:hypothetical protein